MFPHPEYGLIEVGDRDEAAAVCRHPLKGTTLAKYSRTGAKHNPCPRPVTVNPKTRRDEYWLDQIRDWDSKRPGQGDHGGIGYHNRAPAHARQLGNATIDDVIESAS